MVYAKEKATDLIGVHQPGCSTVNLHQQNKVSDATKSQVTVWLCDCEAHALAGATVQGMGQTPLGTTIDRC